MRSILLHAYRMLTRPFAGFGLRRFWAVQALHLFVSRHVARGSVEVQGDTLCLDRLDTLGLAAFGTYDPTATQLLTEQIHGGDVALDIGAHIGYYTLLLARLVGPEGHVYAFEPDPENFKLLERNVATNHRANVSLVQKAVGDRTANAALFLSSQNLGDHRLYDPGDEARIRVQIECVDLNNFFRDYEREINFVKIDIQGAEWAAIQGMSGLLERFPGVRLLLEYWPWGLRAYGANPETLLRQLEVYGFDFYDVNEVSGRVTKTTIDRLLLAYSASLNNATNLYCVRDSRT